MLCSMVTDLQKEKQRRGAPFFFLANCFEHQEGGRRVGVLSFRNCSVARLTLVFRR
jgi:hypothetical protein